MEAPVVYYEALPVADQWLPSLYSYRQDGLTKKVIWESEVTCKTKEMAEQRAQSHARDLGMYAFQDDFT